jgi:hypothetical protein
MEMLTLMADHNAEGHLQALLGVWMRPDWNPFWNAANCGIEAFEALQISENESDEVIWKICQTRGVLLLTCNRNSDGDDSLEVVIRRHGLPSSLPVLQLPIRTASSEIENTPSERQRGSSNTSMI